MRLPYLKSWDKTPITVTMTGEMDDNGAPETLAEYEGLCNFTSKTTTVRSPDGELVKLGGILTIKGDIAPSVPYIKGYATIHDQERVIYNSEKVLNPDGSVNHTRLELL